MAVLWGCHRRRMAQGWWRWDGAELWAVPRCPRLIPGFCWAFGGSGKFKLPFFGKAGSTGGHGEGVGIPRDADVRPDHGKESCGFSIPSCYTALGASRLYFSQGNNPASVFIQTPPEDVGRYGEALGLKVKLWEQPGSVPGGGTV